MIDLHRSALAPERVSALAELLEQVAKAAPELKSSVRTLFGDPANRPVAISIIDWFWLSVIPEMYHRLTGHSPALLVDFTTVRRHIPGRQETRVGWHIDANFVGFDGAMCVFWVPVDPVGEHAPGLEFAVPAEPVERTAIERAWIDVKARSASTFSDADVAVMHGDAAVEYWRPSLQPGDFLVFDQWAVHRTDPRLDSAARTAIEFRVFSPESPPRRVASDDRLSAAVQPATGDWIIRPAIDLVRDAARLSADGARPSA
ncbi:hypothetical protein BAL199_29867 [alpha proteobacterium BAL199]|jgi:hypothetical protein|nr:hypothetical protein BAL199_29867 [alpha proteobacterium BAL199]